MKKDRSVPKKKPGFKDILAKDILELMHTVVKSLKPHLSEKKLEKRVHKAVKLLTAGIKSSAPAKKSAPKKAAKKTATVKKK